MKEKYNCDDWNKNLNKNLRQTDKKLYNLIKKEKERQFYGLELIASENFTSQSVLDCNGSCLTDKYSEGLPGARYYGGTGVIDEIETLCQERCLKAFSLDKEEWGVNVQPYSGSPANFATFSGLLKPNERIMGLDLPSGGHLTHGYQTAKRKISATSVYFESMPYKVDNITGLIDYEELDRTAKSFQPKLIICGYSAYPRDLDYERFRKTADDVNAILHCDMAHFSGLVASKILKSPFEWCDVVTTTTHKTLRGPRAGLIFYRKYNKKTKEPTGYEDKINNSVFPGLQGGPHNNTIAGIATAMKQVLDPTFRDYSLQVVKNAKFLGNILQNKYKYKLVTGGTDNHILLWDLRPLGLSGSKVELLCDLMGISLNKNAVIGDTSALSPGGVRIGTSALTSRSFKELEFKKVAQFLHRVIQLSLQIQKLCKTKLLKEFKDVVKELLINEGTKNEGMKDETINGEATNGETINGEATKYEIKKELENIKKEVNIFSSKFPLTGFKHKKTSVLYKIKYYLKI